MRQRVTLCGSAECPGRKSCRGCRKLAERARRAGVQPVGVVAQVQAASPVPRMQPESQSVLPGLVALDELPLRSCLRCGEMTRNRWHNTRQQQRIVLCERCERVQAEDW